VRAASLSQIADLPDRAYWTVPVRGGYEIAPIDGGPAFCVPQRVWDGWFDEAWWDALDETRDKCVENQTARPGDGGERA